MADHNDPNAVNSIFSDIDVSAADLYDLFGFPSADTNGGENVVIALTFASVPEPGLLDHDMLYRIQICAEPRVGSPAQEDHSLKALLRYFDALKDKYLGPLLDCVQRGEIDPSFVITHTLKLEDAAKGYTMFKHKDDGCIKVVLKP